MSYLLSVVIPAYNCEATLEKAVASILRQPSSDQIEIIIVDDGSEDGTPALCDRLRGNYSNVSVLHKQNGGAGPARNAGIDLARGKYLALLDSDDWWEANVIDESIMQMLESGSTELYSFSFQYVSPDQKHSKVSTPPAAPEDAIGFGKLKYPQFMHWSVFYKLSFLREKQIRYPRLDALEDTLFLMEAISAAASYQRIDRVLYNYYTNLNSFYHDIDDAVVFRAEIESDRVLTAWAQQNAPGVVIDPRGTLSNIVKYLPRHCAAHSYADTLEFFDDPLYAVMKDPALQPWTRFQKDWALWKKDSKRFWLKSRLIWGIPCALKASRTKKPFVKLKNEIWYRLIKRIY